MRLFLDMDGVLADFDQHHEDMLGWRSSRYDTAAGGRDLDWDRIREVQGFFLNIPPMKDMNVLWGFAEPRGPIVLTGIPGDSVPEAADNKRLWVAKHLGPSVPVICCKASEKYRHCLPGDVLVDDWDKYRERWRNAGGTFITHTSAVESVRQLEKIMRRIQ